MTDVGLKSNNDNNSDNNLIYKAPYGRNFRGAGVTVCYLLLGVDTSQLMMT